MQDYEAKIDFQEGALTTVGHNGLFSVAFLAILIDHLKSFQEGEFATREAAVAITNLEQAMHWLCARADERAALDSAMIANALKFASKTALSIHTKTAIRSSSMI